MDEASAVTAMRIVIENPALGRLVVTTGFPPSLAGASSHSRPNGILDVSPVVEIVAGVVSGTLSSTYRPDMWMRPARGACHHRAKEVTFCTQSFPAPLPCPVPLPCPPPGGPVPASLRAPT
ncbi:hypothetical protein GCM10012284_61670 [Mangrovihabitans endophyticus]|uniref:Uncharacterized protein n=1 Tax=Mangrovihabitans endophyticus TaxID=1751298 RepID=A0A8J3C4R0_9ACTN|nr:hypothetical protein GCM10012284_61670 [Mangrovihabitans endophyticus]